MDILAVPAYEMLEPIGKAPYGTRFAIDASRLGREVGFVLGVSRDEDPPADCRIYVKGCNLAPVPQRQIKLPDIPRCFQHPGVRCWWHAQHALWTFCCPTSFAPWRNLL
jgi:hypothetical protein